MMEPQISGPVEFSRIAILGSTLLIVLSLLSPAVRADEAHAAATSRPATQPALAREYEGLLHRAEKSNAANPGAVTRWGMNIEHCLVMDDQDAREYLNQENVDPSLLLHGRIIAFVRRPGALDYVFTRLLDGNPDDQEVLADAQLLLYAGDYYERPDEILPPSRRAWEVLIAAKHGRFASAEKRWPKAPIREKIEAAARRSIDSALKPSRRNDSPEG